jgi:hypothetical protein
LIHLYREDIGPQSHLKTRLIVLLLAFAFGAWWVHHLLSQPRLTLQEAVINIGFLSLMVGLNLTIFLVELGPKLTRRFSKTWVKALDYPYLIFGFGGIVRVVNGLPTVSDRVDNLDSVGLLFFAGAISVRLAKATLEVFFDRQIAEDYVAIVRETETFESRKLKELYAALSVYVARLFPKSGRQ